MGKSYRIKTDVGVDKNISFQLEQDFEFLEILSLQISQNDVYTRNCADYGVVIGRVVANGGFGVPNVKVSIFVPITETDALNEQIVSVYPYTQPNDRNTDGVRFNLLPSVPSYTKHAAVGTFPTRDEVLKDPTIVEVFDKYYKYTVKTNESGDYMIFGVPLGQQTIVMDLDLSDIGEFSLTPQDLIRIGRATEAQVAGDRFLTSTDLESLPQIVSLTKTFEVNPFWGDPSLCQAEVNRVDFDLREEANINIEPTAVFMGSMFSSPDSYRIGAPSSRTDQPPSVLGRGCKPKDNTGAQCENITGPGQILAVRQTINQDSQGRPILEEYRMENSGNVIDSDGTWLVEVPMNLDYVTTSEDGTRIFSNDPKVGIPTKGKYRFKVKWQQAPSVTQQVKRPYYLVPNVREYGWQVSTVDPIYNSNPLLFKDLKSSYYFGLDWSGYTDASTTSVEDEKLYNAINCIDTFYEFQYNKVFTVSSLIDQYKRGDGRSKFIGVKDINDTTCASTTNPFPVNDAVKNFDTIYFLFSLIFQLFQLVFPLLLVIYHIIAFLWNNLAVVLLPIIIGLLGFLAYAFGVAAFIFPPPSLIFLGIAALCGSSAITLTVRFKNIVSFKFGPFNLPMITYPECVGCDCTPGESIAGDSTSGTSLLTPLANPALYYDGISEGYLRFAESEDDDNKGEISDGNVSVQSLCLSQAVGSRIYRKQTLGIYKSTESEMLRLPEAKNDKYFAYGTSLPMAQRVNQFNSRKKYFDGLNRISVSFDNPSNTTKQHFDNTLTILSQSQFSSGTLLTFVNPENSSDKNYKFSSNTQSETGISGTTLFTGPSTVTINYATSQTTDTTQTYTLSSGSTETNYNFPADIEYYQVVTAITVSDAFNLIAQPGCASCKQYVLKCDDSTVGQLFAYFSYTACDGSTQYVNLTNIYDTTSQDWVGETQTVCACALPGLDSGDGTVTFVGTPCQIQPTYNSFLKLINSSVSIAYARKQGLTWDKYTTSYQPRQIFEGYENQYILILQRGVDPYSPLYQNKYGIGKILGFPNENDVTVTINSRVNVPIQKLPNGGMSVQDHTIQADYFYPSKFFEPGNGFSAFTTSNVGYYSGLDSRTDWKNFENSGNRTLKSYNVDGYFDYPTNSGVILTTSKGRNEFFDTQIDDGKYDSVEDISGLDFYWLETSGEGKKPSQVENEYISVSLLPQFQQTPLTIANKNLNVMRTDRLPSSDFLEGTKWNGIVPVLQQNLGFTIYEITTQYQEDFTTIAYGTGADTVSPDISDLPGSLNVVETFSCSNMVSIDCYSGDGKTFGVKADCQNNDIVYSGCYRFMTKPLLGLSKDLKGFGEYGIRYRFFYALCRGVVSQTFTNNWINGTLYTPPVQIRSIYDGDNTLKKTIYCKEFVFFDSSSNNFYMRSSPYNPSSVKGFIGKRQTPSAGKLNEYNLLFPTTIMNLGPKSDIYSEISLDPTYKGFVMKDLNPTSYGDTSDILTFFVISRITNSLFMQLLSQSVSVTGIAGVFTNNNIINILFSREERRIDGDAAQLLSINSEEGVIKFSADAYESYGNADDPVQLYGNLVSGPVMGIFFSSTTQDLQVKDYLTPGKINFRATPASSAIQYSYGIKSQEVPFYQWELNPPRKLGIPYLFPRLVNPTIFGSEENNWATNNNDLFSRKYQSLDRTNIVSPSYFIGSNTLVDETRARGYIFMEDNNGVITPNEGNWPNKFLVGAPFQFYFGLKKGATALDKFKSKYLADE